MNFADIERAINELGEKVRGGEVGKEGSQGQTRVKQDLQLGGGEGGLKGELKNFPKKEHFVYVSRGDSGSKSWIYLSI